MESDPLTTYVVLDVQMTGEGSGCANRRQSYRVWRMITAIAVP